MDEKDLREFTRPISYFDVYVYFDGDDVEQTSRVEILRNKLLATFPGIRAFELEMEPLEPHPKAMLKVHVYTKAEFSEVIPWLTVYRDGFSVLIHPKTSNNVRDRTYSAMWLGDKLELKL